MSEMDRINDLRIKWAPRDEDAEDTVAVLEPPHPVKIKRLASPAVEVDTMNGVMFQRCGGGRRIIRKGAGY